MQPFILEQNSFLSTPVARSFTCSQTQSHMSNEVQTVLVPVTSEYRLVPCFDGEGLLTSWKYTWTICSFNSSTRGLYCSREFTVGNNSWRIIIHPEEIDDPYFSISLKIADSSNLADGWPRRARFRLILVDQNNPVSSKSLEIERAFRYKGNAWGFRFIPLEQLHDSRKGYVVNSTLVVAAEIFVPKQPTLDTPTDTFDSYFTTIEELINAAKASSSTGVGLSSSHQISSPSASSPGLEEVEKAKQSLKECLTDIFKLNVRDRLAEALLRLSLAKTGLSADQQESIKSFWANFNEFTSDFLTFEQDNAEFELQKLLKDQMFATMNNNLETHASYKRLLDELSKEEEELKGKLEELQRKVEEVKSKREKLTSDWEILMVETDEAKSGYRTQEKKVAEAEEKKRVAEERLSRSTTAWSNLKAYFG